VIEWEMLCGSYVKFEQIFPALLCMRGPQIFKGATLLGKLVDTERRFHRQSP
jgi:hypothetical protein